MTAAERKKVEVAFHILEGDKKRIIISQLDNLEVLTLDETDELIRDLQFVRALAEDS
jgi:hypothetical protein